MPVPRSVVWDCKPHTIAKHQLLERYLEAWYPILMQSSWRSVTYAEGFAGPGVYTNGERGSPVRAAEVFLRRRHFLDAGKVLNMVLVEEDKRRVDRLRGEMHEAFNRAGWPPPHALRPVYKQGECATDLLPALARAGARRGPIFAFLDSYGGPDIPLEVARAVATVQSSEVLITFGTSFLTRFGAQERHQQSGDQVFGGPTWRKVHSLPADKKKSFLVDTYRRSLQKAGFKYVISFEMIDDTGADLHLVFGTSSLTGLEKMKDAMWRVDPVRGVHYRDPRDPEQMTMDFEISPNLGPLEHALLGDLLNGGRTVAELQDHALLETVYRRPHVTSALPSLARRGLVDRQPSGGQIRKATRITITTRGRQHLEARPLSLF